MDEDLRESEDQFRTLANAIPQLCGMANPDGRFFWTNQRWCDYSGLSPEQIEGWGWLSALDLAASSAALESWRTSIATGEPFESVFAVRGADGIVRPFLGMARPLRDHEGKVVRWFGTMTDISEQRRTEDALRKAHDEERARAIELQAIMDAMPIAMFISHDPECRYVLGNHSAYEMLPLPPGSNLSKSPPAGQRSAAFRYEGWK
jgi:PAS domain S-box-containing protein